MNQQGVNFLKFNSQGVGPERAFEAFCNHLFERWVARMGVQVMEFRVINGAGGDGGIEAYVKFANKTKIGIQAKWYLHSLGSTQISAIRNSILTAMTVHSDLQKIIIAVPRNLNNKKVVKRVPAKQIASSTEQQRFDNCISDIKKSYPNLEIEFWGQHQLETQCMYPENAGIKSYWFDVSSIDFSHLRNRFDVAKSGWLSLRYVADLHSTGFIQSRIDRHLRKEQTRKSTAERLRYYSGRVLEIDENLSKVLPLDNGNVIGNFKNVIAKFAGSVDSLASGTEKDFLNLSTDFPTVDPREFLNSFSDIASLAPVTLRPVVEDMPTDLQQFDFDKDRKSLRLIALESHPQFIIFTGDPGVGKTHALANTVEECLAQNIPAFIIQARHCSPLNLGAILRDGLDAFFNWTDNEILSALESMAHLCEAENLKIGKSPTSRPKAVICIDGIDEAPLTSWPIWTIRINELSTYAKKFPGVQFILSFRSSFEMKNIKWNDANRIYDLPPSGDIPVHKLFPAYSEKYATPDAPWIGYALVDLISLRLFCELYQGKRDTDEPSISTSLTELINKKIELIEEELARKLQRHFQKEDQILLKVLNILTNALQDGNRIGRSDLLQLIVNETDTVLDQTGAGFAIGLLKEYAVISEVSEAKEGVDSKSYSYYVSHESIIEFVLAKNLALSFIKDQAANVPPNYRQRPLLIQMASDILLTDYKILLSNSGLWSDLGEGRIMEISIKSIGNLSAQSSMLYRAWGKQEFVKSPRARNLIIGQWIIPSVKRAGSPFNALFLHEILSGYDKPFDRDLVWSGPGYYDGKKGDRVALILGSLDLDIHDNHEEMPLVFAWALTSLDNRFREQTRIKLTFWASNNISEAIKLTKLLHLKYDPQLDQDWALVLLGAASLQKKYTVELEELSNYIIEHVFSGDQIIRIKDSIVRHACRGVVERCNVLKPIDRDKLEKVRPPYKVPLEVLPLEEGKHIDSGRYPIVGDLAWYVIDDSFKGFMDYPDSDDKQSQLTKDLLQHHHFDGSHSDFALSAAIAYIRSMGLVGKEGHTMTQASHGSLSEVSTLEEKYTWLAVRYLQGYFADTLPFKDDFGKIDFLQDYVYIVDCYNPANGIESDKIFPKINPRWVIPTDISPKLTNSDDYSIDEIKSWVDTHHAFDFEAWHFFKSSDFNQIITQSADWIALENYTSLADPTQQCRAVINSNAIVIKIKDLTSLIDSVSRSRLSELQDFDVDDLHAKSYAGTVVDAIWMHWLDEWYPTFKFQDIAIRKSICQVSSERNGESTSHHIPAKQLREWLDIQSGNEAVFISGDNEIVGFNSNMGEAYHDRQELLVVDRARLELGLAQDESMLVWALFRFRKTTPSANEKHNDFHWQNCRLSLVWQDGGIFKEYVYHVGWARNTE